MIREEGGGETCTSELGLVGGIHSRRKLPIFFFLSPSANLKARNDKRSYSAILKVFLTAACTLDLIFFSKDIMSIITV